MIEFRTLGTLELRADDGRELRSVLVQPKRVALLVYLALARPRGFQRRDTLLALFWPELDTEHARASLRAAVHRLRAGLGDEALESRGNEELGLRNDRIRCDAAAFEDALDAGRTEEALALYHGDLLAGFYVREAAPEFEHWLEAERARLRERARETAWQLADERLNEGRREEAVRCARRAVELAPEDEPGLRRVVELLDRTGDRAGALRAYEDFARRMDQEFGVEPAAETRALIQAVRSRAEPAASRGEPTRAQETTANAERASSAPPGRGLERARRSRMVAVGVLAAMLGALAWIWLLPGSRDRPGDTRAGRASPIGERPGALVWHAAAILDGYPRTAHSAVFDPRHRFAFLYGGSSAGEILGDVMLLEVGQTLPTVHSERLEVVGDPPRPRALHTAVLDTAASAMIVFGGALGHTSPCSNDVWLLENPTRHGGPPRWRQLRPSGGPAPAPRADHSAVYDPIGARMMVFGGHDCIAPLFGDVWVLEGANGRGRAGWTRLEPESTEKMPAPRHSHAVAYHPGSNRMIVYGGVAADYRVLGDVWSLENANGLGGRPRWVRLEPRGSRPRPRQRPAAGYDPATDRLLLFGGLERGAYNAQTWMLEGASGARGRPRWRRLDVPTASPPPMVSSGAFYDPLGRLVVPGGHNEHGIITQIWMLLGVGSP